MKRTTWSIVILACLAVVLSIATAFTAVSSANALGNTGVPVRCYANLASTQQGTLLCSAADGTAFGNNQTVPTGYYLLVTDAMVAAAGAVDPAGWAVYLMNSATSPLQAESYLAFTGPDTRIVGEHFNTPYLVLHQGEYLRASVAGLGGGGAEIFVSGLLTTNVNYVPLIGR